MSDKGRQEFSQNTVNAIEKMAHKRTLQRREAFVERKAVFEKLKEDALVDNLTGLYNRIFFEEEMTKVLAHSDRTGEPVTLLIMDVDDFKRLNDQYSHLVGDEALRALGGIISGRLRDSDSAARWGGEEIVIIMQNTTVAKALKPVEDLREEIAGVRIRTNDEQEIGMTVSIGMTEGVKGDSLDSIFERADTGLRKAKRTGKNRVNVELFKEAD